MEAILNNGEKMPMVIFGTFQIKPDEVKEAILSAIKVGYIHFDAAALYKNETEIGEALSEAVSSGLTTRENLYITTKAWCSDFRNIKQALLHSLKRLRLTYVDQYLLHWPFALRPEDSEEPNFAKGPQEFDKFPLHLVWKQMEELVDEGLVKSIGVSNWTVALLHDLLTYARIPPVVNQFEINPYFNRKELVEYCHTRSVIPVAYRLLYLPILSNPTILEISQIYGKSPSQVIMQWCLARNCAVIAKTVTSTRMVENWQCQEFKLEHEDVEKINAIPIQESCLEPFDMFRFNLFS